MNQKGKVFSLIALSGAMLFSFVIIGKNFDFSGVRADNLNTTVEDVIDFDGSKLKVVTVEGNYVCRSQTKQGDYVYLINKSVKAPDSGAVANIRSMYEDDKSLSTIKFAKDSKNTESYVFQNLKGISMVSNTRLSNVMVKTSDDGVNYHDLESLVVNTYDDSLNAYTGSLVFSETIRDSYFMLEQVSEPVLNANIKRLVLSYSCDNSYIPPVKHSISTAPTENGSVNIDTTRKHVKGETINFNVQPASGYIVSDVYTIPETALSVSGSNYSFEMPEDDVSIHASFELAPLVAYNVSAQASSGGSVSFSRTQYYENESVAFTVTPNSTYEIESVSTSPSLAISGNSGSYSFTMPASDVEIAVSYKQISSLGFSGNYQTEFDVDDTFNHDNLVVTANYSDSTSRVLGSSEYNISSPDMSSAGNKSVTVSYRGVSNSYNINVVAPDAIESIEVSGTYKTNYYVGDTVDHSGVVVKAVYTSGTKIDVTSDVSFTDPKMTYQGTKFVTVKYGDFSTKYEITVSPAPTLSRIDVTAPDSAKTFYVNDEFNHDGVEVIATYSNGDEVDVSDQATFTPPSLATEGSLKTVSVSFGGKSATYFIKAVKKLTSTLSLEMDAQPVFTKGTTFNHNSVTVKANYNTGSSSVVSTATFSLDGQKLDTIDNDIEVTVTYTEQNIHGGTLVATATYTIKVEEGSSPEPVDFAGTYYWGYIYLVFNSDGSGAAKYYEYSIYFSWVQTSTTTIKVTAIGTFDEDNWASKKIFFGNNSFVATITSETTISVKVGPNASTASAKTFTKQ